MPDVRTDDWLLGEGVCCIYQEIQSGCCNVARDRLQHKKEIKIKISPLNWLRSYGLFSVFGESDGYWWWRIWGGYPSKYPFVYINNKTFEGIDGAKEPRTLLYVDIQEPGTSDVIRIGTTHLDHSTDLIRSAMAEQINERIGTGDTPTLLGEILMPEPTLM